MHRRRAPFRQRRDFRWRQSVDASSSRRRDRGRACAGSRESIGGAAATALNSRERRSAGVSRHLEMGTDTSAPRARTRGGGGPPTPDRHARGIGTASAQRRQSAKGGDRALAGERLRDIALLRRDPRHRYRHEASDIRARARAGRKRIGGAAVHVRADRNTPGLRSRDRLVRWQNRRRNTRQRRRRGNIAAGRARARVARRAQAHDARAGRAAYS